MQSPCNIDWIYPHKTGWQKDFYDVKIYTTHIHTHIITHHIGTCHFCSITANKILIDINNKILNFDMQIFHCMTHPQMFSPNCLKGTIWTRGKTFLDNGDLKETQIPGHIP